MRVKEFSNEYLEVKQGKLFCLACREELSQKHNKKSGNKHKNCKEALVKREARERLTLNSTIRLSTNSFHVGKSLQSQSC